MDDRLRICLWMVGGGGLGTVLGGVFGGLTGLMFAQSGHTAGTGLARRIADAIARTAEQQPSPPRRAVFIGVVDGVLFLGVLGLIAGILLGASGRSVEELLVPALVGSVALVGGGIFFGTLAYALTRHTAEFLCVFAGCFAGGILAARMFGSVYGPVGIFPGLCVGLFFYRAVRRYSPKFHPPRVGKTTPQPRSDGGTGIICPPPSPPHDDFFRKPGSFEEPQEPYG